MALSRVGGTSAAATSIAIPAHVAGDLIVIWAFRDGSTTPPTVPTAGGTVPSFTTIDGPTGANTCAAVCAYAFAAGTTDTSGTWTNATGLSVEVWRGAANPPIGDHAQSGGNVASGGNIAIPAITPQDPGGHSVFLAFAGWRTVTAWNAAPAGYTQRSQVATECEALTKDTTTSDGTFNVSGTASGTGGTRTQQLEILVDAGNRVSQATAEIVYSTSGAKARVSQEAAEVIYATTSAKARVSQAALEVLGSFPKNKANRVSQIAVELLRNSFTRFTGTIAGTSSLSATVRRLSGITAHIAGTASLSAAVTGLKRFTATIAGRGSLSATVASGSSTITASIAGTSSLSVSIPISVPSGTIIFAGDDATIYPVAVAITPFALQGDNAQILGAIQATSGVVLFKADSPGTAGPTFPPTGTFTFRGDNPNVIGALLPQTGRVTFSGDAPTVYPLAAPSAKFIARGDPPSLAPSLSSSGRVLFRSDPVNVWPLQAPSGAVLFRAGDAALSNATIILHDSGILRFRADTPVITPLTEPPTPPPPVPGTGMKVSVTL